MNKLIPVPAIMLSICILVHAQEPSRESGNLPQNDLHADVKLYGATGDGVTDDAPAVRRAVAAVEASGGGTVYFPAGKYYFNSTDPYPVHPAYSNKAYVTLNGSGIHVQCAPGAVLNTAPSLGLTLFMFGLYGDGIHGEVDYEHGYRANAVTTLGASNITLSSAADAVHFKPGDLVYILGGPGKESNGDGELNWITTVNAATGELGLLKPTSKPYTGNNSNIGLKNNISIMNVNSRYYYDNSVEGCTANLSGDFTYFGTVIGIKLLNNSVNVAASAPRGMMLNSYFPLGDVEVAGNQYVMRHGGTMWQLADGFRDLFIHDNDFTVLMSGGYGGGSILNLSQGVINTHINHNNMYLIFPAENATGGNVAAIVSSTAYQMDISNNQIFVSSANRKSGPAAITLGMSNGSCQECTVTGNFISDVDAANTGGGINDYGSGALITNNRIVLNGGRAGIITNVGSGKSYSRSLISSNYIEMLNTAKNAIGIGVGGSNPAQGYALVTGNYILGETNAQGAGIYFNAAVNGDISHNYIANLPNGLWVTGTPQMIGNECVNVVNAASTHCSSAQMFPAAAPDGNPKSPEKK